MTVELYVRHACEFCAEAEALLQAEGIAYVRIVVEPSSRPGHDELVYPDGRRAVRPTRGYLATPYLLDREAGCVRIGLGAIEAYLDFL